MPKNRICPECGWSLPEDALGDVCPVCSLKGALKSGSAVAAPELQPPASASPPPASASPSPFVRDFGDYELLEEIARGGMGIVYKARQKSLDRIVALKLLLFGPQASPEFAKRFRAEAVLAASLQHPNIVAIHEVGAHEGQQFFVMDYVAGPSLAKVIADCGLRIADFRRRAQWVKTVAEAIHYAHERGILHRDIKPSNVLIDADDQPRVTDFGLAKRFDATDGQSAIGNRQSEITVTGQVLGSPNYIPPEQALGKRGKVSRQSDVYALGAMLYHLLTGRPPFQGETLADTLQQVLHTEPLSPRWLNPSVPRDLETICLKCLEKEPARRYATAQALADELERFLNGQPVLARPIGLTGKVWRWCRRWPVRAGLIAALVVVFAAGASGVLWQWRRAQRNAEAEAVQRRAAEQALSHLQMQRAEDLFAADNAENALAYLARLLRENPANRVAAERLISALTHRSFARQVVPPLTHVSWVHNARFSPDGRKIVTASNDKTARVWDAKTGDPMTKPLRHDGGVVLALFSPDGQRVVTASDDGTARIWNALTGEAQTKPLRHGDGATFVQFSPDSQRVVTASWDGTARVWDAQTGEPVTGPLGHSRGVTSALFSPDGRRVVTACMDNTARIWDASTGKPLIEPFKFGDPDVYTYTGTVSVQFSPDGNWVVTASYDGTARVWDAGTGQPVSPPLKHDGEVCSIRLSPDGQRVVTGSADKTARIWDARTGEPLSAPLKHDRAVWPAMFSPDGLRLVTGAWDSTVRVWDARTGQQLMEPFKHDGAVKSAQFSPDGLRVVTASEDKTARILDVPAGEPLTEPLEHQDRVNSAEFSPDGKCVITASKDKTARIWDSATSRLRITLQHEDEVLFAEFSPDGQQVLTASRDKTARVWNARTGEPLTVPLAHADLVAYAHFSPDGKWVLTASKDGTARVWDARTGQPLTGSLQHGDRVNAAAFSLDGRQVITAPSDRRARIWDARTGQRLLTLQHGDRVLFAEFSPDGTRVVTASADYGAHIWDSHSGKQLVAPLKHRARVVHARFSPDGAKVVTAAWDRTARLWNARTGQMLAEFLHQDEVKVAEFSPNGQRVLTASSDKTTRVWDVRTGLPLTEPLKHKGEVVWAKFSPDGQCVVTASYDGAACVWEVPVAPLPLPGWLPELAEAVAGERLSAQGMRESVPYEEYARLKKQLADNSATDFHSRWARWFFADRATRTISPFSSITMPDYVQRRIEENTVASLQEAVRLSTSNALATARLAMQVLAQDPKDSPRRIGEAAFFSRRSVELAPDDAEVLRIRNDVAEQISTLGKPSER